MNILIKKVKPVNIGVHIFHFSITMISSSLYVIMAFRDLFVINDLHRHSCADWVGANNMSILIYLLVLEDLCLKRLVGMFYFS